MRRLLRRPPQSTPGQASPFMFRAFPGSAPREDAPDRDAPAREKGEVSMFQVTRPIRARLAVLAATLLASLAAGPAAAYVDQNLNRIDDRIESVHANGWNAAFVNNDPTQKMRIGVSSP